MATIAFLGKGTQLKVNLSGVDSIIGEVKSITGPSLAGSQVDVTNMDSVGRLREFIAGPVDPGTMEFEVNYNPNYATHQALLDDVAGSTATSTTRTYTVNFAQLTPAKGFTIQGFALSSPFTIPVDNAVTVRFTIQCSGAPIFY